MKRNPLPFQDVIGNMQKTHKNIETLSNIAIIVVATVLGVYLVNQYFFSASAKPYERGKNEITAGTKMPPSDVDWSKSEKTLVMALSATCRYCTESVPFYQKLAEQKIGRDNLRVIAILPQSVAEARKYLAENKITVDEIKQPDKDDSFAQRTPTLILVDNTGTVIESWTGKLPLSKETEVLNAFLR